MHCINLHCLFSSPFHIFYYAVDPLSSLSSSVLSFPPPYPTQVMTTQSPPLSSHPALPTPILQREERA
jgi:hypothetical protein